MADGSRTASSAVTTASVAHGSHGATNLRTCTHPACCSCLRSRAKTCRRARSRARARSRVACNCANLCCCRWYTASFSAFASVAASSSASTTTSFCSAAAMAVCSARTLALRCTAVADVVGEASLRDVLAEYDDMPMFAALSARASTDDGEAVPSNELPRTLWSSLKTPCARATLGSSEFVDSRIKLFTWCATRYFCASSAFTSHISALSSDAIF
mmetsp:Transcript_56709/g.83232  ORF Transcript_56709/g.83232 Transcript_56709/m.83232 type:complete len:215 (-) Transcript_56709:69-713(-)